MNTEIITQMILNCVEYTSTNEYAKYQEMMSPEQFFRDFKTVIIKLPRGQGCTSAAINILKTVPNSLLVVPSYASQEYIKHMDITQQDVTILSKITLYYSHTPNNFLSKVHDNIFDVIMIDPTSIFYEKALDELKQILASRTKLFVQLS